MEPDVSNLLTVREAIELIDSASVFPRRVEIALHDAIGARLARDILADRDYPPFDKSLMDGFAVRSADASGERATLRVIGEIAAGATFDRAIGVNECAVIYTGAPMPAGADAVIPVEFVESRSVDSVTLRGPATSRQNIASRGHDCRDGQVVLKRGSMISPAAVAVAASVGAHRVEVFAPARVGVISTGDELIPIDRDPSGSQIRNSNSPMLVALARRLGCDARDARHVRDDKSEIRAAIVGALHDNDVLLVSGGMSMGEYDFVPRVLQEIGCELKITKLKIKPGKPFVFAVHPDGKKFVFGLPGNPVSSFACTLRLSARLFARIAGGSPDDAEQWIVAKLTDDLAANGPREFYQPAVLNRDGTVTPLSWKGSADIYTLASANALLVRPENARPLKAGEPVQILQFPR